MVFIFVIGIFCIAATAAEIPPVDKQIILGPIDGYHRYYIHVFNVDDIARVKINTQLIATMSFKNDSGWIEITKYLVEGDNTIELTNENGPENGWAYGFDLKRDDSIIWSDSCGMAGSLGCEYDDITTGLVYRNIITLKLVTISPTHIEKKITLGPYDSYHKYYIRMQKDLDDTSKVSANGQVVATMSFRQDSGWIEITGHLLEGDNTIELTYENGNENGWAYGFDLKQNDSIIWSDSCGTPDSLGCKDDDITKGLVYRTIVTLKLIPFSSTSASALAPAANPVPTQKPNSTPAQKAEATNSDIKPSGVFLVIIGAFMILWLFKKLKTPK
ncbi:MAG: hypothetical protein OIN83_07125 [Candidatus Methanoperedens sp.]|nr:hypothetical protein [Candidatus Methanoperedens sp.]